MNTIDHKIAVSGEAFDYLRLQKGKLDPLAGDRRVWHEAYEADLLSSYNEIAPFLPERCWALLDIGSGLGGIDVLLYRHYGAPFLNLLDGLADQPKMKLHRETFSSKAVATAFLRANGVRADRIFYHGPDVSRVELAKPYDLVLSLGSWCFHYEPKVYLPRLIGGGGLQPGARVIVDMRRDKPEWERQLREAGLHRDVLVRGSKKFDRIMFVHE